MMFRLGGLVKRTWISDVDFGPAEAEKGWSGREGRIGWLWVTAGVARPPQRRSGARRYPPPCCAEGRAIRPSRASPSGRGMALAQALAREFDAVGVVNVGVGREIRRRRYLAALSGRQNVSALARRRFRGGGDFFRLGGARGLGGLAGGLGALPWR